MKTKAVSGAGDPGWRGFLAAWRPRDGGEGLLFLAGVSLSLLGFIVARQAAPAFRHPELAVLAFVIAYFGGISFGYSLALGSLADRVRRLIPFLLVGQLVVLAALRPAHAVLLPAATALRPSGMPAWTPEAATGAVLALLLGALVTPLQAIVLPRAVALAGRPLRRCYSLEVAGGVTGVALAPLLAVAGHAVLLGTYCVAVLAMARLAGSRGPAATAAGAAALLLAAAHGPIDSRVSAWSLKRVLGWRDATLVHSRQSAYQKVEVVEVGGDTRLVLDGRRQFGGDPDRSYAFFAAEYPSLLYRSPRIAVLGCGSMSTVGLVGRRAAEIHIVDIDEEVFEASRRHFQAYNRLEFLGNWIFHADDAKHFLATTSARYDLIVHDIPPARSRQVALTYTREFLEVAKTRLTTGGIFSISCLSPVEGGGAYARRLLATLASVFERHFVLRRGGSLHFYGGGRELAEPSEVEALALLPAERSAGVRFLPRAEIGRICAGAEVVTVANVGALIYD